MNSQTRSSKSSIKYKNPLESQAEGGGSAIAQDIEKQRRVMEQQIAQEEQRESYGVTNSEFTTVFDLRTHTETVKNPQEIKELTEQMHSLTQEIKREVADIKRRSEGLNAEVDQIERATLQSLPEKAGIYHVRYLEILLSFLRGLKAKVGEAKTWLMAMNSKKKKRGSAFMTQRKKKGNEYAMSPELQSARNVM